MSSPKKSSSSSHKKSHSGSSGRRDNRNSDSGFGSLRDHESVMANPDGNFTAEDYTTQNNNLPAIREALASATRELEYWKAKYARTNDEVTARNKELREQKSLWQAQVDRNEALQIDNLDLQTENKRLRQENAIFRDEIAALTQRRTSPPLGSPTVMMSGAGGREREREREPTYPAPPATAIPTRTMSKGGKSSGKEAAAAAAAREREDSEKQKNRLSRRFERDEKDSPPSSSQGRYIEGWGPGGRPRRSSSVAAPSHRLSVSGSSNIPFNVNANYTTGTEPVFAPPRTPTFSNVPRTYDDRFTYEDGNYQAYPLPDQPKSRGRRP